MKKLLLLLAVFALVISHAEAQNSYKIEGNVVGLPDGELVLVAQQETGVGIVGRGVQNDSQVLPLAFSVETIVQIQ